MQTQKVVHASLIVLLLILLLMQAPLLLLLSKGYVEQIAPVYTMF